MSKLYDDLMDIIDFELDKDEEKKTERYIKTIVNICDFKNVFPTLFLLFVLFLYWFGGVKGCLLYAILLTVYLIIYKCCRGRFKTRMSSIANERNFNKLLTVNIVLARYAVRTKDFEVLLLNICNNLFYMGKFEEIKKVMDLVKKYCDTPKGNAYRASFYVMIARYEMDRDGVEYYTKELEKLMPQANIPNIDKSYDIILRYPLMMEAEEKGDYAKALELIKVDDNSTVLDKVGANYRLYKIAKVAGLETEASKHKAFVLKNGGDSFYKRELQDMN